MVDPPDLVDAEVPHRARRQGDRDGEGLAAFADFPPPTPDRRAAPRRIAGTGVRRPRITVGAAEAAATGISCDRRGAIRTTSTPPAHRRARRTFRSTAA